MISKEIIFNECVLFSYSVHKNGSRAHILSLSPLLASPQTTKERHLSFFDLELATMLVLGFWNFFQWDELVFVFVWCFFFKYFFFLGRDFIVERGLGILGLTALV